MKSRIVSWSTLCLLLLFAIVGLSQAQGPAPQATIGTVFAYQGRLNDGGNPANGTYDFEFGLYDTLTDGTQVGSTVVKDDVSVDHGLFTVELDFGDVFDGTSLWLEVAVKADDETTYTTLSPRQALMATPYALYARKAKAADAAAALQTTAGGVRLEPGSAYIGGPNVIGGFSLNTVAGGVHGATISGGGGEVMLPPDVGYWTNSVGADYATVGGGSDNQANGPKSTVSGGTHNTADADSSTVGGGRVNSATRRGAAVSGGENNTASANYAAIGGGYQNSASGTAATVPGGESNVAQGDYSFAAGRGAQALHDGAFVWADSADEDFLSTASDQFLVRAGGGVTLTVTGGALRLQPASDSGGERRSSGDSIVNVVAGWAQNFAGEDVIGATVSGGGARFPFFYDSPFDAKPNFVTEDFGTVSGGLTNSAQGYAATVSGGENNTATGAYSTVSGGGGPIDGRGVLKWGNVASGLAAVVSGGRGNEVQGDYSTISGGQANSTSASFATIGGGGGVWAPFGTSTTGNRVTDDYGTVGGGGDNQAGDDAGTTEDSAYAAVGGGKSNAASGASSTVGGGESNQAQNQYATVGGGFNNTANGWGATVDGGHTNSAVAHYATVGGGASNTASGTHATVPGGYMNTAQGAYSFAAGRKATATNQGCFVWGDSNDSQITCNVNNRWMARATGGVFFYSNVGLTTGVYLPAGGSSWNSVSDRATKENFVPADSQAVLEKVASIPLQEYNLKSQDASIRHIGPVAQDFYAAFGYGESDTAINMEDADGVALTAIQGLYEVVQEQKSEIAALQQQNADLEARLSTLEVANGDVKASPVSLPKGLLPGAGVMVACLGLVWLKRRGGKA